MLWPRVEAHHCTSVGWNSRRTLIGCARACSFCQWGGLTVLPLIINIIYQLINSASCTQSLLSPLHYLSLSIPSHSLTHTHAHTSSLHHYASCQLHLTNTINYTIHSYWNLQSPNSSSTPLTLYTHSHIITLHFSSTNQSIRNNTHHQLHYPTLSSTTLPLHYKYNSTWIL